LSSPPFGGGGGEAEAEAAEGASCADDLRRAFWWAQRADGELEVRVPLAAGVRARDVAVEIGAASVGVALRGGAALLRVGALQAPIRADESSWEMRDAEPSDVAAASARADARVLALTLVKVDADAHWPALCARPSRP
jgi:hypothetical protein